MGKRFKSDVRSAAPKITSGIVVASPMTEQREVDLAPDPGGLDQRDHVVQRHHGVGHDYDPDGVPDARTGLYLVLVVLPIVVDEPPRDPDQ